LSIVIKVENLSKAYQLGQIGTGTVSRDLERWWAKTMGKDDPFLKIGEVNDRATKSESNIVWSLKDINFEIEKGDAVGIIGRNGAGKSTLLKLLSRVTAPTTGTIKAKGRIASLLEVGTGFHPELTGRENIYLNGAILGMRKKEITQKLDAIIDFSGVERYIDTPVKRYSSGMYVRLAFAVAAHLDSEILIVDEVLAVGDAEFQKKCLGKMKDVSTGEGRTVLFVSHNMTAVQQLCSKAMILDNGVLLSYGDTKNIISQYIVSDDFINLSRKWQENDAPGNDLVKLTSIDVHYKDGSVPTDGSFSITEDIGVTIYYTVLKDGISFIHGANIYNQQDMNIFNSHDVTSLYVHEKRTQGVYKATMWIPGNLMSEGNFSISIALFKPTPFELLAYAEKAVLFKIFDVMDGSSSRGQYAHEFPGYVRPLLQWEAKKK
jgi:lipopolysaccharide transport system ATP-binding protein